MKNLFPLFIISILLLGAGCLTKTPNTDDQDIVIDQEQQAQVVIIAPSENERLTSPFTLRATVKAEVQSLDWQLLEGEAVRSEGVIKVQNPESQEVVEVSKRIFLPTTESGDLTLRVTPVLSDATNGDAINVPVRSNISEKTSVNIFFIDPDLQEFDCSELDFEKRTVAKTENVAELALTELLAGPTSDWAITSIPPGTELESVVIEDGLATVKFTTPNLATWNGGSCHVTSLRAQIEQTLKQFPAVEEVTITVNGETEEILQP